jgi:hypothetical protein
MANRMTMFLVCFTIMLGLWLVWIKPVTVQACSCATFPTVEDGMKQSTAIFAGKVISLTQPDPRRLFSSSADPVKVVLEVSKVWKGELAAKTEITTAMSSVSCGYEGFDVDEEYLVFANADSISKKLETGLCNGNRSLASAEEELKALGQGYAPALLTTELKAENQPGEPLLNPSNDRWNRYLYLVLTLIVFVVAAVIRYIFIKKRRF